MNGLAPLESSAARLALNTHLLAVHEEKGPKPTAAGTRLRISDAHKCSRAIAFSILKVAQDIPMDPQKVLIFAVGDFYHETIQAALEKRLGSRSEVVVDYSPELSLSGSCDGLYDSDGPVVVEIKSMGSYGYELAVGVNKYGKATKEPPGPKVEHLVQVGLYALSPQISAQIVHVIYVNKNNGDMADWLIDVDQPLAHIEGEPSVRELVEAERERMADVLDCIDGGALPARFIPGHGYVKNPSGREHWSCRYCPWQPTCAELPSMAVPIDKEEA